MPGMTFWTGLPFWGAILVALGAWVVCVVNSIKMMQNANVSWTKLVFKPFWWWPGNAERYLSEEGMEALRTMFKAMAVFFVAIFAGMMWALFVVGISET